MTRRVRFDLPTSCDCGARGIVTFEEDDIHERKEGNANTVAVAVTGPFTLKGDKVVCGKCARSAYRIK